MVVSNWNTEAFLNMGTGTPIPERLLARLWQKRAARRAALTTVSGSRVRVIYPGRPGRSAGPDFRNALLEVEGVGLVQGDVEIHPRQRDWEAHGHGQDPNYNGVVLHAALQVDSPLTSLQSGGRAQVVGLGPLLEVEDPAAGPPAYPLWGMLGRLGYPRPGSAEELASLLDRAGDDRFLDKSACFGRFLGEQGPEQTLYEGLMEALGYRHNQAPFLKLAARAPYLSVLQAGGRLPLEARAGAIESWLLRLSGLSSPDGYRGPDTPLPRSGFGPSLSSREWHCFRVRPANHPRRRIGGAARLVVRYLDGGLVEGLRQAANAGTMRELISALTVLGPPGRETAWIGAGRARDLAVNVVLPFLHALDRRWGGPGSGREHLALYRRFGKLQENELTREMAEHLVEPRHGRGVVDTARRQQGLLHLHSLLCGGYSGLAWQAGGLR
jgi:hypothetical protein